VARRVCRGPKKILNKNNGRASGTDRLPARFGVFCARKTAGVPLAFQGDRSMKPLPFYKTPAWRRARRQALHDAGHKCGRCGASLVGMGRKAHVHHLKPYRVAPALGIEPLNLVPLCIGCHDSIHHEMNRKPQCGVDGRPLTDDHPWFAL
jgi:hypothetical protein